jgi:hypothetical protein
MQCGFGTYIMLLMNLSCSVLQNRNPCWFQLVGANQGITIVIFDGIWLVGTIYTDPHSIVPIEDYPANQIPNSRGHSAKAKQWF